MLGCTPAQRALVCKELQRHDAATAPPVEVTNEVPAADRIQLYRSRACCFVTTRILVVDMLSSRILPKQIAGMIVVNAHKVRDGGDICLR